MVGYRLVSEDSRDRLSERKKEKSNALSPHFSIVILVVGLGDITMFLCFLRFFSLGRFEVFVQVFHAGYQSVYRERGSEYDELASFYSLFDG